MIYTPSILRPPRHQFRNVAIARCTHLCLQVSGLFISGHILLLVQSGLQQFIYRRYPVIASTLYPSHLASTVIHTLQVP